MTKDEALKLALSALDEVRQETFRLMRNGETLYAEKKVWMAIYTIKEALAQPEQEPVAWKLVPIKPTDEMLKAMDECSIEGYDEGLYAGHAASVYMAGVDVAPTPPQRKPLTDEQIDHIAKNYALNNPTTPLHFARAIEAAHGIKENT